MANTADKLIKIALNEVGYLEKKSNKDLDDKTANAGYNNWTKYARDLYKANYYNGNKNGYAWCDVFVDWCFYMLCDKDAKKAQDMICQTGSLGAACGYSRNYYKNKGRFYSKNPLPGDQIFFWNSSKSAVAHTGIVYDVDKNYVYTVEGNTSGASGVVANGGGVCKKKYSLSYSRLAGYGRPKYDGAQNQPSISYDYLMRGDKGAEVKAMQENLIRLNYSCGSTGADGSFGAKTEDALIKFQKANGLVADGKYDKDTKEKIEYLLSKQIIATPTPIPTVQPSGKIDTVMEVQNWANKNYSAGLDEDGKYGKLTKKALIKILQKELNQTYKLSLNVDGSFGHKTKSACPNLKQGLKNDVVGVLQAFLICNGYNGVYLDNSYGAITTSAVKSYQKKNGLFADGIAGKNTFAKLCN